MFFKSFNTPFKELALKQYPFIILRVILYGEIKWEIDEVYNVQESFKDFSNTQTQLSIVNLVSNKLINWLIFLHRQMQFCGFLNATLSVKHNIGFLFARLGTVAN